MQDGRPAMTDAPAALVAALRSPGGRSLLQEVCDATAERRRRPAFLAGLRRRHPAPLVTLALRVAEAAERAPRKFPDADRLLFTPALLEQATPHPVAARRAARLAPLGRVLDAGCGAGGDLTRLALAGAAVVGLERDPLAAALAAANLAAVGGWGEVRRGVFPADAPAAVDALFVDPARRDPGRGPAGARRRRDPADFAPAPGEIRPWLDRVAGWAVKWGPGLPLDHAALTAPGAVLAGLTREAYAVEVVSWNGAVREAVLWGGACRPEGRTATLLVGGPADAAAHVYRGDPDAPPPPVIEPGPYLAEPDGALLRAGLLNAFAREHDLALLAPGIAYLTAERPVGGPWLRWWRRLATFPFSLRRLQRELTAAGAGRVVVKKRGFPLAPEELRRRLRLRGEQEMVVFIHRTSRGHMVHLGVPDAGAGD